ncbi:DNA-(apurinic or apyrimidinic site) lyase /formamidopyrimidine-DNA glycosylase [Streptomyces sp. 1114.5]|uniref:Fpg/Nei family DNA glycosylase n=1 Tax=unclassified Streptomyces TaxID=2593676 RepID=UPI000BC6A628|nr:MULTISPECIES: DNA-formamidopyrimidine glycosylase family protein [unclassified Streptomyces]RKT19269.1 DNA-(apurinic or apyrimidinic site) lyase /formamidopyrimidine-DNA glycosylase [Streptomyces sp. 1114.5]SOB85466.1 DNA-(apurinic or apyrimidinic site) lyase /Formamidopyrimidine-DNA glycosylase [Streptomyces sp. 1331.2]
MPELPEVEALSAFLSERLTGRVIARVQPVAISALKTYDPPVTALEGRTVGPVTRRGKFLDIEAGGLHLVVHLARAGWLRWKDTLPAEPPHPGPKNPLALRLRLEGEAGDGFDLTEAGTKKGLAVYVVKDPAEVPGVARLGPDPLDPDFTQEAFAALLHGDRRRIKGVLRDQSVLAGVGNAYSDEVLHAARMSPYKIAASLTEEETARLYEALGSTLRDAVERSRGLAAGELKAEKKLGLRVHGRTGQPCPVCGDTVREVSFADSSLQYCPTCQTGGKPLADRRLSRLLK